MPVRVPNRSANYSVAASLALLAILGVTFPFALHLTAPKVHTNWQLLTGYHHHHHTPGRRNQTTFRASLHPRCIRQFRIERPWPRPQLQVATSVTCDHIINMHVHASNAAQGGCRTAAAHAPLPAPKVPTLKVPACPSTEPPMPSLGQRVAAALLSAALMLAEGPVAPAPSMAVLNSPNARIARSADAALRRSVPAFNADVKDVQAKLEVRRRDRVVCDDAMAARDDAQPYSTHPTRLAV